jgi:methionine-rich copper-binding protein CopC
MDSTTFTPDQVAVNGPGGSSVSADSVTPVAGSNNTSFTIAFTVTATGKYTMVIGPNILDLFGNAMDQNGNLVPGETPGDQYTVAFNVLGPKVTTSQTLGDTVDNIYNTVRVSFNEAMDPTTFTTDQVKFASPSNDSIAITSITPVANSNNTQFDIAFASQGKIGNYTMVIGPNVQDTFGNAMDQNGNLTPGETPGDQYTHRFTVVGPKVTLTSPVNSLEPVNMLRVTFSKPIDVSTFTASKIASFGGPGGPIGIDGIYVVPGSNNTQFDVAFRAQTTTGSTQTYSLDNGSGGQRFNNSFGGETEDDWVANSFQVNPGGETLSSVSFLLGENYTNRAITVLVYTGSSLTNPHAGSGLTRISTTDTTVTGTSGTFVTLPFSSPVTLSDGQVYWVALLVRNVPSGSAGQFPFWIDTNAAKGQSWYDVASTRGGSYNVDDTSRATVFGGKHPVLGGAAQPAGNLMLRVNSVGTGYHMLLGPNIRDLFGNQMDQNGNLTAGQTPDDQYLATFNLQGLRITTPASGARFLPGIDHVRLAFNEPVDPTTFTANSILSFTGPDGSSITVNSVTAVPYTDYTQFDVSFDPLGTTGTPYTLVVAPTVQDLNGNQLDQNGNGVTGEDPADRYTYTFGILGLRVISSTPSGDTQGAVDHVRLTFNEAVDPTTFTTSSIFSFTGPSGAIAVTGINAVDDTNTVFDVTFAAQTQAGSYTMVIGPNIQDSYGNQMDQNNNLVPGETPGDRYMAQFTLVLLRNGGFETGDFTGWTVSDPAHGTTVSANNPHTGRYSARFGSIGQDGTISQTITTIVGHHYQFSFWEASGGGTPNDFSAKFGGVTVYSITNESSHGYVQHTFDVVATSTSTVIQFAGRNDPSYDYLDDVTVIDTTVSGNSKGS